MYEAGMFPRPQPLSLWMNQHRCRLRPRRVPSSRIFCKRRVYYVLTSTSVSTDLWARAEMAGEVVLQRADFIPNVSCQLHWRRYTVLFRRHGCSKNAWTRQLLFEVTLSSRDAFVFHSLMSNANKSRFPRSEQVVQTPLSLTLFGSFVVLSVLHASRQHFVAELFRLHLNTESSLWFVQSSSCVFLPSRHFTRNRNVATVPLREVNTACINEEQAVDFVQSSAERRNVKNVDVKRLQLCGTEMAS